MIQLNNFTGHPVCYEIANEDISLDPQYFGYLSIHGEWIIQKRTASAGTYEYTSGASAYSTSWTARAGLSYVAFSEL